MRNGWRGLIAAATAVPIVVLIVACGQALAIDDESDPAGADAGGDAAADALATDGGGLCDDAPCTCPPSQTTCAKGACVDTSRDPQNCGNCGNVCSVCVSGQCGKTVFVTKSTFSGKLGGVAGADVICQTAAEAAKLSGTYKAWLSSRFSSPSTRFAKSALAYRRTDGVRVVANFAKLVGTLPSGQILENPINRDETGGPQDTPTWTGTDTLGAAAGLMNCGDWMDEESTETADVLGQPSMLDGGWTNASGGALCNSTHPLYCFEQ